MGVREVVETGFGDQQSRGYAAGYSGELLTTWREAEKSTARAALLMFVLALAAEVLIRGKATEVTVGFVKLTDLTLVSQTLPVAIAYLYSSIGSLAAETSMAEAAFSEIVRVNWPSLWRANLERPLYPSGSIFSGGDKLVYTYAKGSKLRRLIDLSAGARVLVVILAPLAILLHISSELFERYGADPVLMVSAALSGLLAVTGLIGFVASASVLDDDTAVIPGAPVAGARDHAE
jgi:hypothetical protein